MHGSGPTHRKKYLAHYNAHYMLRFQYGPLYVKISVETQAGIIAKNSF